MERDVVQYLLVSIFGMMIFIGVDRIISSFNINPFFQLAIGVTLIYLANKLPIDAGIPRVIGGVILFITLKPYIISYISSAYIFIGIGVGGLFFLQTIARFVDKYI